MAIAPWEQRTSMLLTEEEIGRLHAAHILLVGLGGVGGYALEVLTRAGIGEMTIVDGDVIEPTNINRQILATHATVGRSKVEVAAEHIRDINPDAKVHSHNQLLHDEAMEQLLATPYDLVIDAIDTLTPKCHLVKLTCEHGYPLVGTLGSGARLKPYGLRVAPLANTHNDPLGVVLRKRLRKLCGELPNYWTIYSEEPAEREAIVETKGEYKRSTVGTISYLPALFGTLLAAVAIEILIGQRAPIPELYSAPTSANPTPEEEL